MSEIDKVALDSAVAGVSSVRRPPPIGWESLYSTESLEHRVVNDSVGARSPELEAKRDLDQLILAVRRRQESRGVHLVALLADDETTRALLAAPQWKLNESSGIDRLHVLVPEAASGSYRPALDRSHLYTYRSSIDEELRDFYRAPVDILYVPGQDPEVEQQILLRFVDDASVILIGGSNDEVRRTLITSVESAYVPLFIQSEVGSDKCHWLPVAGRDRDSLSAVFENLPRCPSNATKCGVVNCAGRLSLTQIDGLLDVARPHTVINLPDVE